ncbi:methylated-DNA--[protein]-cysteine S-methyltransferase [Gordonia sinesedis]
MTTPATPATVEHDPATGTTAYATIDTPDGPFTIVATDSGQVLASGWTDDPGYLAALVHRQLRPADWRRSTSLTPITDAVAAYYAGDHEAPMSVPVTSRSGPFLEHAWPVLRQVPAGAPVTYTRFAELAGNPLAIRAAAAACSRNPAALFVPCHRVLRGDGSLGGFRYGLDIKRSLLDREAAAAA